MPKATKKTKLTTCQIEEIVNDSDSGDDLLGALTEGESDDEDDDIRFSEVRVSEQRFRGEERFQGEDESFEPPPTAPGAEVLSWLAMAPPRREPEIPA